MCKKNKKQPRKTQKRHKIQKKTRNKQKKNN